ncbi:Glycolipid anchored surface protein 4 precursor [Lithohypha guttulata]|uniref:1,3-beta-glucanosyltransferase n=1 Tax=Lithohypha guttulata TaxID=1690604 RepID=A0AAN7T159_9EURO|nr:Glycolipid anchored surface protein 4 precursor [Lithohypha guttulata]KAK5103549.1 Glycolipid anchored surface protein 4 precursor [Lithohypha guttulata]
MVQFKTALAASALLASTALAVTPVVNDGLDFVNAISGARFQMIGVAYQPGGAAGFNPGSGIDPLSDAEVCLRDAILMQRAGINTVRIYNLDPALDHTQCMSIFNAAGIYLVLDVNSPLPNESINRAAPWTSYNADYMRRVFQIIEAFKNFNNTLGFFSANEVINEESDPSVPRYIRAVTRDIKDYIAAHSSRHIPVGYSAADVRPLLVDTFNYLSCNLANSTNSGMDFFGLNSYSWCGDASFEEAGYNILLEDLSNTSIPIFFSEYGCNQVQPRTFTEVGSIYSAPMTNIFSGGLVYEYSEEPNNYGLVTINGDNSIELKQDYLNLVDQYGRIDLAALTAANSTATQREPPACAASMIRSNLTNSFDVPARLPEVQDMINNGVNGTYPTGFAQVTNTNEIATVTNPDGSTLQGLELRVLAGDQSNLPGENTSGTTGTAGPGTSPSPTSSGSSSTGTNAASSSKVNTGAVVLAALTLGFWAQL